MNRCILAALQPDKPKPHNNEPDEQPFILRIPYISEAYSRIVKKAVKDSGIKARVVVTSGTTLESMIQNKPRYHCQSSTCLFCPNGLPCNTSHYVYKFSCNTCSANNITAEYIGASRRSLVNRFSQHEASVRRYNTRTTLGQHMIQSHPELRTTAADQKRGKVDFGNLLQLFTPEILKTCKDTLDTFLWEGLLIRKHKPALNNMLTNGFIE